MLAAPLADQLTAIRRRLAEIDVADPESKDEALWQEALGLLARVRDLSAQALVGRR
jgi:hypothetical protein